MLPDQLKLGVHADQNYFHDYYAQRRNYFSVIESNLAEPHTFAQRNVMTNR